MSEKKVVDKKPSTKKTVDWEIVERHYRAGIKTLRQIGEEYGCSHVAIQKRAKTYGWTRDLTEKIAQKTQELVTKAAVTKQSYQDEKVTKPELLTDAQTVQEYGQVLARVEMAQRDDLELHQKIARSQLKELEWMTKTIEQLTAMGEALDETYQSESGRIVKDKVSELYQYVISFHGRVKALKEISAAMGVSVPLQRKILKLDAEGGRESDYEDMLRAIGAQTA